MSNNEQIQYRIVRYKRPRNHKRKTIQTKTMNEKKYVTQQQTTTTKLQAPDKCQAHTYRKYRGKHVSGSQRGTKDTKGTVKSLT